MNNRLLLAVITVLAILVSAGSALGSPSTNASDYFFYDDMNGGSMAASWGTLDLAGYSITNPYPGGTKSIQVNSSGNVNLDNILSSTNFTSAEYAQPHCMAWGQYDTQAPGSNTESGVLLNAWATGIFNRNGAAGSNNLTIINSTAYKTVGPWFEDVWYNVTVCFTSGYAGSGSTTAIALYNGVNYANSTIDRSPIGIVGLHNRLASSGISYFGPFRIWNYTRYGIDGPQQAGVAQTITIKITDLVTNNFISGFCINATGTNTSQYLCNATGDSISFNTTGTYNITAFNITSGNATPQWFNVTQLNYVFSTDVTLTLSTYQGTLNIASYKLFSNDSINNINATNNKISNSTTTGNLTILSTVGTQNILINVTGNYTKNITCTLSTALTSANCAATGIYDNLYTIGAKFGGASVSSFTVGVFNSTLGGTLYNTSTTNGSLVFPLLQGYTYVFSLNTSNYTRQSASLPANATTHLYNFTLLASRQVSFIFRDEITRNIINNTNMTLEVISDLYATNLSTTNGTLLDKILTFPTEYTFRYRGGTYTERQYFLNVTDETNTNLTLYAIELNQSDLVTVTVSDTGGNLLEGATVKLLRYFLYCNCYEVVEMERTGPDGTANVWVQPVEGHYKWSIDYAGVNYFVSSSPETIISTTKYFSVELGQDYYAAYRALSQVGTVITLNTSTGVIAYTWSDPSGVVTSACLTTYRYIGILENLYNSSCDDGATGGVITVINTTDGRRYKYVASVNVTSSNIDSVIYTGFYDAPFGYDFGTTGQFLSLIVVVVLAIVFSFSVAAVLVSVGTSLVVLTALGLMTFSTGFIAGAVAVLLGLGIFLVRR